AHPASLPAPPGARASRRLRPGLDRSRRVVARSPPDSCPPGSRPPPAWLHGRTRSATGEEAPRPGRSCRRNGPAPAAGAPRWSTPRGRRGGEAPPPKSAPVDSGVAYEAHGLAVDLRRRVLRQEARRVRIAARRADAVAGHAVGRGALVVAPGAGDD